MTGINLTSVNLTGVNLSDGIFAVLYKTTVIAAA
ncbi:MAG: hypothetical protein LBT09_13425 [Planctomycetaceae bacterium]|nr:hypothetical protein [Planctomycetaceae bacterium]